MKSSLGISALFKWHIKLKNFKDETELILGIYRIPGPRRVSWYAAMDDEQVQVIKHVENG